MTINGAYDVKKKDSQMLKTLENSFDDLNNIAPSQPYNDLLVSTGIQKMLIENNLAEGSEAYKGLAHGIEEFNKYLGK